MYRRGMFNEILGVLVESIERGHISFSQELEDYASRVMVGRYKQLAMGGQQTATALALVREASKAGSWLCLKNLHLVVHWVPELEKELSTLSPAEDFRLWLTTEEHASFPTIILQQSLKVTFEAPPGIAKNLERTYESLMYKEFVERGPSARAQLLFVLSWFHAVLQEGRMMHPATPTMALALASRSLRATAARTTLTLTLLPTLKLTLTTYPPNPNSNPDPIHTYIP